MQAFGLEGPDSAGLADPVPTERSSAVGAVGDLAPQPEAGGKDKKKPKKTASDAQIIVDMINSVEGLLADLRDAINAMVDGADNLTQVRIRGMVIRANIVGLKASKLTNAQRVRVGQLEDDLNEQALKAAPYFQDDAPAPAEDREEETAPETGFPLVDDGYACERETHADDPGCTLTSQQRRDLGGILQLRMLRALINYQAAIQNARLEELTKTEHGWGFLEEFLFYSVSGALIAGALKALAKFQALDAAKLAALGLPDKVVNALKDEKLAAGMTTIAKDVMTNASRGIRTALKQGYSGLGDGAKGHAAFLEIIQDSATSISQTASEDAPATMNDTQLVQFTASYEIIDGNHTVASYRSHVDEIIGKYDRFHVGDLAPIKANKDSFYIARLTAWGQTKTAVLKYNGGVKLGDGPRQFVRFVDPDFAGFVEGVAVDRGAMQEYDVKVDNVISDSFLAPDEHVNPSAEEIDKFAPNNNDEYKAWRAQCESEYYAQAQANDDARKNEPVTDDDREIVGGYGG